MALTKKAIFLKSWLWSVIGGAVLAGIFWMVTDVVHVLQNLHSLTAYTDVFLSVSLAGNAIGAGLVLWRVSANYYREKSSRYLRRYIVLSILTVAVGIGIILVNTPLTVLIVVWNVLPAVLVYKIVNKAGKGKVLSV